MAGMEVVLPRPVCEGRLLEGISCSTSYFTSTSFFKIDVLKSLCDRVTKAAAVGLVLVLSAFAVATFLAETVSDLLLPTQTYLVNCPNYIDVHSVGMRASG